MRKKKRYFEATAKGICADLNSKRVRVSVVEARKKVMELSNVKQEHLKSVCVGW